jgi:hypothetical protein
LVAVASRALMTVLLFASATGAAEEGREPASASADLSSYIPGLQLLPTGGGGARGGEGGSTRIEHRASDVSAERVGVTMDFPEWLRDVTGRKKPKPAAEQDIHRRQITWAPFITSSPLVGVGFGVGAAGTRQRGDPQTTRLSKFTASVLVTTQRQYSVPFRSDIVLPGGDWNLVGLWVWSKFPSPTWGLGGNTPDSAKTTIDYQLLRFYEVVNRRVAENFYLGAGYRLDYYFNVKDQAAGTGRQTEFQTYPYGTGSTSLNSSLAANILYDTRDSPVYATRGFYGNLSYAFTPRFLGSDTTWQTAYLDLRGYLPLARRLVLGLWTYAWFDFGEVPYLELPSIGSDPDARSGRGYIEGRHRGKALLDAEAELRFTIWEWLGAVLAFNAHSASQPDASGILKDEPRFQYWWPAVVVGARILAVKATHSNVAIDFAFGRNGQNGVYFNFAEAF